MTTQQKIQKLKEEIEEFQEQVEYLEEEIRDREYQIQDLEKQDFTTLWDENKMQEEQLNSNDLLLT